MKSLLFLLFLSFSFSVQAQMDTPSTLLLRGRSSAEPTEPAKSNRYIVRPESRSVMGTDSKVDSRPSTNPEPTTIKANPVNPEQPQSVPGESSPSINPPTILPQSENLVPSQEDADIYLSDQMKSLFLGGSRDQIAKYQNLLHAEDPRLNLLSINITPTFMYQSASSGYWFRNYFVSSPALKVGGTVWLTPFFGVTSDYTTSLASEIKAAPDGSRFVSVDQHWFDVGIRFRKFFGLTRRAPRMIFGLDYHEHQLVVPRDELNRARLTSSGVRISLETTLPQNTFYNWTLGAELLPRLRHSEKVTADTWQSGSGVTANAIGAWVGGEFNFSRRVQTFWRLRHIYEKDQYKGTATLADPMTGLTPEGVTVNTSTTFFEIGFSWGY